MTRYGGSFLLLPRELTAKHPKVYSGMEPQKRRLKMSDKYVRQLEAENRQLREDRDNLVRARLEEQKHTTVLYRVGDTIFTDYGDAFNEALLSDHGAMIEACRSIETPWQDLVYATRERIEAESEDNNG